MSWIHVLIVLLRKSIQEERGGHEISWIHFLIVLSRKLIQEAEVGERGCQEMS